MYRHTQPGYLTLAVSAALAIVGATLLRRPGSDAAPYLLFGIAASAALLFGSLTTVVADGQFRFRMGIGLIRRRFALADIAECSPVENPIWYGWGIRLTPHGWLFNVSGLSAVSLTLANGRTLRVGTDEPRQLCEAIIAAKNGGGA